LPGNEIRSVRDEIHPARYAAAFTHDEKKRSHINSLIQRQMRILMKIPVSPGDTFSDGF
jgi:hypothetical protein